MVLGARGHSIQSDPYPIQRLMGNVFLQKMLWDLTCIKKIFAVIIQCVPVMCITTYCTVCILKASLKHYVFYRNTPTPTTG